jgi:hypothetical protein
MLGYNVLFDWEHGRTGFAQSTCEYPDGKPPLVEVEVLASNSCILGEPTLSNTCLESLDLDQCEQNPNRILHGYETWSMVVTNWQQEILHGYESWSMVVTNWQQEMTCLAKGQP